MFSNIGSKIRGLAIVTAWLGIITSIVIGALLIGGNYNYYFDSYATNTIRFMGFLIIIMGSLSSWISSWVLYGFGELIVLITEMSTYPSHETVSKNIVPCFVDREEQSVKEEEFWRKVKKTAEELERERSN